VNVHERPAWGTPGPKGGGILTYVQNALVYVQNALVYVTCRQGGSPLPPVPMHIHMCTYIYIYNVYVCMHIHVGRRIKMAPRHVLGTGHLHGHPRSCGSVCLSIYTHVSIYTHLSMYMSTGICMYVCV